MSKYIRDTHYKINEKGEVFSPFGHKMSPWIERSSGYILIRVRKNKKHLSLRLHRILAEAFIPNPKNMPYVRHLNDIKTDNRLCNLAWGDCSVNTQEGYDNNCYLSSKRSYKIKITVEGVSCIYPSLRSCEEATGISRKNISRCLKGEIKPVGYSVEKLF